MNEHSISSQPATPLPADNPKRPIKVARPSIEQGLPHIGLVGDTYTILLSGEDTNGRYCLIDMHTHRLRGEGTASFSRKATGQPSDEKRHRQKGRSGHTNDVTIKVTGGATR